MSFHLDLMTLVALEYFVILLFTEPNALRYVLSDMDGSSPNLHLKSDVDSPRLFLKNEVMDLGSDLLFNPFSPTLFLIVVKMSLPKRI